MPYVKNGLSMLWSKTKPDGEVNYVVMAHVLLGKADVMETNINYYQYLCIILDTNGWLRKFIFMGEGKEQA